MWANAVKARPKGPVALAVEYFVLVSSFNEAMVVKRLMAFQL